MEHTSHTDSRNERTPLSTRTSDAGANARPVMNVLHEAFVSLDLTENSAVFQYDIDKLPEKFHCGMLYDSLRRALSQQLKTFVMAAWTSIEPIDCYCLRVPSAKQVFFDPMYILRNPVWSLRKTGIVSLVLIESSSGYFRKKTPDSTSLRPTWGSKKNENSSDIPTQYENY